MRNEKQYDTDGIAGLVETRRCRASGTLVSVYHNVQAKLDCGCTFMNGRTDHDPEQHNPFSTVCEDHGNLVIHKTLALARSHMAWPEWCEECQQIMDQKGLFQ
jgi:hypothetical protein